MLMISPQAKDSYKHNSKLMKRSIKRSKYLNQPQKQLQTRKLFCQFVINPKIKGVLTSSTVSIIVIFLVRKSTTNCKAFVNFNTEPPILSIYKNKKQN
ncbi:hypothetical protein pb186bvf_019726 [Paramecium bursaria]